MTHGPAQFGASWRLRTLAVVVAMTATLVRGATPAEAHDILVGTSPADGSVVAVVPAQVTLTFEQPALAVGTEIIVTGTAGQEQSGSAALVNNTVTEYLRPGSPAGRYTVAWKVTSADGHPVSGQFSFTASSPSPQRQAPATTSGRAGAAHEASTTGHASTLWWVAAGGALMLLLLVALVISGSPRTTPQDERDPRS